MSSDTGGKSALQRRLEKLGLSLPSDFVVHLPLRYEDETRIHRIADARIGDPAQFEGIVKDVHVQHRPRRQLTARLQDDSGAINMRWLHFYPSQIQQLQAGGLIRVRGEVRPGFRGAELVHPRLAKAGRPLSNTLTPVYPTTDGVSQPALRAAITDALDTADLGDTLPEAVLSRWQLMPFKTAILQLHRPPANVDTERLMARDHPAWARIKFDELLAQQLSLAQARAARRAQSAPAMAAGDSSLLRDFYRQLPFTLTGAQQRVVTEILQDLARSHPMHRLLQGDVGSGKTAVAAAAAVQVIASGYQVAIMAPTEILAGQHHDKLAQWLAPLGIRLDVLTGSLTPAARRARLAAIATGETQLVVGTQALIQDHVEFAALGLVILDEQHRFGVGQRLSLTRKGDTAQGASLQMAHQLNMSATPIPRTLAMTFLADLEVSAIDGLPPGRRPVATKLVADTRRDEVIAHVRLEVAAGRQAYWVCPLVEESEALQLQTALDTWTQLSDTFDGLHVGLVHGRMTAAEKARAMQDFRDGRVHVLVATTVIEVGVDIPNASLMIIEHAERFGLAQLHQLRGRVGRGNVESVCVLLYRSPLSLVARDRLRAMYETSDGFEIAQRDLAIRGPGEFLGMRQSGQQLLRFASLDGDEDLIDDVREAATLMREQFPDHVRRHLQRWMRGRADLLRG